MDQGIARAQPRAPNLLATERRDPAHHEKAKTIFPPNILVSFALLG
jgi:hypothetical protein